MSDTPVALVTGSSRGIGRAIAVQLARDGLATVVNYHRNVAAAEEVVAEIVSQGGQATAVQADVASAPDRDRLVDAALSRFGRLDVLVNNAAVTSQGRKDLLEATEESFDLVFATNLKGPFFLAQKSAVTMVDLIRAGTISCGRIINVSSISSYAASTNRADYCMAKAAMQMMTWLFADRLAEENIQVFEISPGVVASDMTAPVKAKYDKLIAGGLTPIRRWGQPDDVARACSAIVQGFFPFSTGQRFDVDGGFHIRRL
jgi:NAD(P)-dependent dehydrogenase (short-subunit alcohol dehydrogenase family)